ncbi:hypothetical protein D7Z26_18495 [Cohnella endophytica]|uniref:Uncharacterized protein n=1 Tax=Cohnella endophytica TaxID=2419778 RepID=A0A494XMC2_9BACL|nr:hypothetical protein [Cohnella endophytica]RKP49826.1 hypothetical protein D7Z26_18495 [Cohnella endophytica]
MIKTYEHRPSIALEVAKLPQAYASYSERQINRLVSIEDKRHPLIDVIEDTIESASTIIEESTMLVESIAWGNISDANDDNDANYSTVNLFPSLNSHLAPLYAGRISASDFEINNTLPVVIHTLGCRLIRLICDINEIHQAAHGVALFTLTQKMMLGFLKIPNTISANEMLFADIVD